MIHLLARRYSHQGIAIRLATQSGCNYAATFITDIAIAVRFEETDRRFEPIYYSIKKLQKALQLLADNHNLIYA
ncbi:MAG: hypothetical protein WKF59_19855 [Chitinophagaceae bacterium]